MLPTFSTGTTLLTTVATGIISTASIILPALLPVAVSTPEALPLPAKLIKKILELDYIDMQELVQDTWNEDAVVTRVGAVTDILVWVECFSLVLASRYPEKTPQFMAYQRTIVRAQWSFTGEGWFTIIMTHAIAGKPP